MKKIYNSPKATVYKVRVQQLMSLSREKQVDALPSDGNSAQFSKGSSMWEDMDEE